MRIRNDVKRNNRDDLAQLMSYPLLIETEGASVIRSIRTKKQFLKEYDRIISPSIQSVILEPKRNDFFFNQEVFVSDEMPSGLARSTALTRSGSCESTALPN